MLTSSIFYLGHSQDNVMRAKSTITYHTMETQVAWQELIRSMPGDEPLVVSFKAYNHHPCGHQDCNQTQYG